MANASINTQHDVFITNSRVRRPLILFTGLAGPNVERFGNRLHRVLDLLVLLGEELLVGVGDAELDGVLQFLKNTALDETIF